jgi:hypothetical protein
MRNTAAKKNASAHALTAMRNKKLNPSRRKQIAKDGTRWSKQLESTE